MTSTNPTNNDGAPERERELIKKLSDAEFNARALARSRYHDRLFTGGVGRPTNDQFDEGWEAARQFYNQRVPPVGGDALAEFRLAALPAVAAHEESQPPAPAVRAAALKPEAWHCYKCARHLKFNNDGTPTYACESCQMMWPAENIVLFAYADLTDEMFAHLPREPQAAWLPIADAPTDQGYMVVGKIADGQLLWWYRAMFWRGAWHHQRSYDARIKPTHFYPLRALSFSLTCCMPLEPLTFSPR